MHLPSPDILPADSASPRASLRDLMRLSEYTRETIRQVMLGLWWSSLIFSSMLLGFALSVSPEMIDGGILGWVPQCSAAAAGGRCALCGCTHALAMIGHGRIIESLDYNLIGLSLFALSAGNLLVGIAIGIRYLVLKARIRRKR